MLIPSDNVQHHDRRLALRTSSPTATAPASAGSATRSPHCAGKTGLPYSVTNSMASAVARFATTIKAPAPIAPPRLTHDVTAATSHRIASVPATAYTTRYSSPVSTGTPCAPYMAAAYASRDRIDCWSTAAARAGTAERITAAPSAIRPRVRALAAVSLVCSLRLSNMFLNVAPEEGAVKVTARSPSNRRRNLPAKRTAQLPTEND